MTPMHKKLRISVLLSFQTKTCIRTNLCSVFNCI